MLPSLIGQYRIVRKIGAGGMGLVYLGEHTLLRRRAAIKTLLPTVAANQQIVERFFTEARATSAISDPGVIQIFDFGYHVDGTAYIVMELLEGEALSARLDRLGKLALGDALRFARQITGSLAAAHAHDIVHRDLKPENIFLVRDTEAQGGERTKIIDFGICKVGTGDPMLTEVGVMIGTPVYMSPEQCRGSGEVDARSDVYAFGCLLFHMLTGQPPFVGEASGDLVVAHLEQEPPPPSQFAPGIPPAVDALVLRCLAKPPDERFASMIELQAALGAVAVAVDAEAAEPAVAAPAQTVPLGRGFRSVYDANLAAALGGSSVLRPGSPVPDALRARLTFAPPRAAVPDSNDDYGDDEDDDGNGEVAPRSRAGVRAALACVLVVGVAAGLIATPLIARDDRAPSAPPGAVRAQPLGVEATPAQPPPGEPITAPDRPGRGAVASAIAAPVAASAADAEEPSSVAASAADAEEPSPAPADEASPPRRSSSKVAAPRVRPSGEPRFGRAQMSGPRTSGTSGASGASGPVRSPADIEPARPARSAPAAVPPPSAPAAAPSTSAASPSSAIVASPPARPAPPPPSAPAAAPPASAASPSSATAASPPARPAPPPAHPAPPPSTEDLYDTR